VVDGEKRDGLERVYYSRGSLLLYFYYHSIVVFVVDLLIIRGDWDHCRGVVVPLSFFLLIADDSERHGRTKRQLKNSLAIVAESVVAAHVIY
jgi:hypothetical protein